MNDINGLSRVLKDDAKFANAEPFSLSSIHVSVTRKAAAKSTFSPHVLQLDGNALTLTSHVTQEEIKLALSSIFDVFPIRCTEETAELFLSAPTPHILQILSLVRHPGSVENTKLELDEVMVMLALSSISECTQLSGRLAEAKGQMAMSLLDQCSIGTPPPMPAFPQGLVQPRENSRNALPEVEKSIDVPCEFLGLRLQAAAWGKDNGSTSLAKCLDMHGYRPCDLHLSSHGVVIEHGGPATKPHAMDGPWSIPWPALAEVRALEVLGLADQPPRTHPQVLRISIAHCVGLNRSTCCTLNIAVDTQQRMRDLLRVMKACQQQHTLERSTAIPRSEKFNVAFADERKGAHPHCHEMNTAPATNRLTIQTTALGVASGNLKEPEPLHVVYIDNIPVSLTPVMASLLKSYRPEDANMPTPFELSQVSILLPTVAIFQRCSIIVDKLGLNIVPLVPATSERLQQDRGRMGARPVQSESGGVIAYHLLTEGMIFPISSIVDCAEEPEFRPTVPVPGAVVPADISTVGGATNGSGQVNGQMPANASNTNGSTGTSSRRQVQPFWRSLAPWEKPDTKEQGTPQNSGNASLGGPPYPHLVGIRVKGALGNGPRGAEKTPMHLRLNSQPPPPVAIVLSFGEKEKAIEFVQVVLAFKRYCLALTMSNYLNTMTALSQRQTERRIQHCAEEGVVAQRIAQCQAPSPLVEPPPLPLRPADLPQANRLPRMVTNDEGEVFWYIPRKQNQPPRPAKPSGATPSSRPTPQPDPDIASPMPEIGSTGPHTPRWSTSQSNSSNVNGSVVSPIASSVNGAPVTPKVSRNINTTLFDDDVGNSDTPAPCLASPTPTPGRK